MVRNEKRVEMEGLNGVGIYRRAGKCEEFDG